MRLTDRGKANTVLREQRTLCFPLADLDTFGKGRSAGCGARRREKVTGCVGSTHPVVLRMTHERTEHGEGRLELDRRQELACAPAFSGRGWFRTPGAGTGARRAGPSSWWCRGPGRSAAHWGHGSGSPGQHPVSNPHLGTPETQAAARTDRCLKDRCLKDNYRLQNRY